MFNFKKKIPLVLTCLFIFTLVFSGWSAAKAKTSKISGTVNFMCYRDDLLNTWYPDVIKQFNKLYPEVKIVTSTAKDTYDQDLKIKMASNDVPDVFTLSGDRYSDAQRTQFMLPLDNVFPELVKNWTGNGININSGDKKTYALTYGGQGVGLAYNKKIFKKLGLTAPKTLDQLIADAKKIKATGVIGFAGALKPVWTTQPYWWTAQALMTNQTAQFNNMTKSGSPFTEDSSWGKMANVLTKLRDAKVMEDDPLSYDWEPYLKDCGSGKVGMTFTWTNTPVQWPGRGDGSMTVNDIGFVPFPYDNTGGHYKVLVQADWGLAISKNSKNPDAAKAWFKFLMENKYKEYATLTAVISSLKSYTTSVSYLKEFANAKPVIVNAQKLPTDFKSIIDKAQIDFSHQYVEIYAGTSISDEFKKMNDAFVQAKQQ